MGKLKAHKHFLAAVSSVFRKQFFGKLAEKKAIIDIKETTYDAFKFLLNYIYNGLSDLEDGNSLEDMFEIINLAEKYDMRTLGDEISNLMYELNIEEANVLEVSRTAEGFKQFEVVSSQLLFKCSEFLKLVLLTEEDLAIFCHSFVRNPEDYQMVLDLLNRGSALDGSLELHLFSDSEIDAESAALSSDSTLCLANVDWLEFLSPASEIPTDVSFELIQIPRHSSLDSTESKVVIGEVRAHKYFLATISEVFKDQFFGEDSILDIRGLEPDIDTVEIIGPSYNAFKVMIDYIYGKYPTLKGAEEICEIFEIINLAERFKITGLEEEYRTALFLYFREGKG